MNPNDPLIAGLEPLLRRVRTDKTAIKTKERGVQWTHEALTPALLAQHLNGGPARGVCPIREGGTTVEMALLDFDSHKGETSWAEMSTTVLGVVDDLELVWGASPILFRSGGGRGVHLLLVWDAPQDAYSVREWLVEVLAGRGLRNGTSGVARGCVEVFPKQSEVQEGRFGSQFFLPLAGHSVPLEREDLSGLLVPLDRAEMLRIGWPASRGVETRERPTRPVRASGGVLDYAVLDSALAAIVAAVKGGTLQLDRNGWRDVVFGIHEATGGSEEGRAIALGVMQGYEADVDKVWDSAEVGKAVAVGEASLRWLARSVGWVDPVFAPVVEDFPVLVAPTGGGGGGAGGGGEVGEPREVELPPFDREKSGAVKPTVSNAVMALRRADLVGMRIAHDEFRDEVTVADVRAPEGDGWRGMTDADLVRVRIAMEKWRFKSAPKELARDAAVLVAEENRYDSAIVWLQGVERRGWDGVRRVERFMETYFGCPDVPYTRALGLYIWTALAGRVLDPGCQADMAPVLEGDQGLRKTSAIAALVPSEEFFVEVDFSKDETETARLMRGVLVGEISELRGLHTKDQESIKAFVSRRHEKWTPKYKEFATTFARRALLFGTTNRTDILADDTGNRRWLPVHVTRADVEALVRDRDQLWAEGVRLWREGGVAWQAVERLAEREHAGYMLEDPWATPVGAWLAAVDGFDSHVPGGPRGGRPFAISELMGGALGLAAKDMNMLTQKRVGAILRAYGYKSANRRDESGQQRRVWLQDTSATLDTLEKG